MASACTNVAKSVEILNLSGNEITTIDNDCFIGFTDLVKLSLARNSIHTIELFAFEALTKLNFLDLSDNRLEVIDNRILEMNFQLTVLDLSRNKFMLLDDRPLIISETLEFLSLRNSHLSHVYDSTLSEISNLVDLDISNNLLNTLMISAFEKLTKLQFINLEYNRFSCDYRIEETLQQFKKRKVQVKINKCVKNSKMFEKMIMHPDVTTEIPDREDVEIELVWGSNKAQGRDDSRANGTEMRTFKDYYLKIKNNDAEMEAFECDDDDEIFPSTCECHTNFLKFYEASEMFKENQKKNIELRIAIIFWLGIFLGIFLGAVLVLVTSCIR